MSVELEAKQQMFSLATSLVDQILPPNVGEQKRRVAETLIYESMEIAYRVGKSHALTSLPNTSLSEEESKSNG